MAKISDKSNRITTLLQSMFELQQNIDALLVNEIGLGLSAYRILSALDTKVAYSQRKVAVELRQTEANVSRQVRHMADAGLVKIAPAKNDKRQRNITRTAKGQRKFDAAEKLLKKHEKALTK